MSHFTVLVIGDDYVGQLAPYDEELEVDPYRRYADTKDLEWYFRVYAEHNKDAEEPDLEALASFLTEHWGEEWLYEPQGGIYQMSTFNPVAKWDWYAVGGRWAGYFKLKKKAKGIAVKGEPGLMGASGEFDADIVRKGDVDVEAMRGERGHQANKIWNRAQAVFGDLPEMRSWEDVLGDYLDEKGDISDEDLKFAREEYGGQLRVKAVNEHNERCRVEGRRDDEIGVWGELADFQAPLTEYVQEARDATLATFAYVRDGEWYAPGKMGWFGMSDDTRAGKKRFWREFNEMFDALPDDTLLTLVDAHI